MLRIYKSLMRMFGPKGNRHADSLFPVIHHLQDRKGIYLDVMQRHEISCRLTSVHVFPLQFQN